jgi:hypothetical protein
MPAGEQVAGLTACQDPHEDHPHIMHVRMFPGRG